DLILFHAESSIYSTKPIENKNVSICIFDSLWDTIALVERADLVISVDTAIVHIACALNKKIVSIYFSQLIDDNKNYHGNKIFAPIDIDIDNRARQLIFDTCHNGINISNISKNALSLLSK
ncbi:MAG: hypothetical protein EKE20_06015, partial [Candidatus Symbiopectobacterium sp. Dall1.0]|nr:hypothetical protein [Candidatus Symbiopectobacterium sp. Dall1.0]